MEEYRLPSLYPFSSENPYAEQQRCQSSPGNPLSPLWPVGLTEAALRVLRGQNAQIEIGAVIMSRGELFASSLFGSYLAWCD